MGRRRATSSGVSFFAFQDVITSIVGIFILITIIMILELVQSVADRTDQTPQYEANLDLSLVALAEEVELLRKKFEEQQSASSSSSQTNSFNKEDQLKELDAELKQLQDRTERARSLTEQTEKSIRQAEVFHEQLVAESLAAESDRNERDRLLSEKQEIERFASVLDIDGPRVFRNEASNGNALVLVQLVQGKVQVADSAAGKNHTFATAADFQKWLSGIDTAHRHFLLIVKPSGIELFDGVRDSIRSDASNFGFEIADESVGYNLAFEIQIP